jgi:hypothetical protein
LPSATLGKGFAEGIIAFAECIRHSAKRLNPVVKDRIFEFILVMGMREVLPLQ